MRLIICAIIASLYCPIILGQTVEELFEKKNFEELVKLHNKPDLTSKQLYIVGLAFYRLSNDKKAIELYDKAMVKGLNNGTVHFYKGLSLRYLNQYDDAMKEIDIAINMSLIIRNLSMKGV